MLVAPGCGARSALDPFDLAPSGGRGSTSSGGRSPGGGASSAGASLGGAVGSAGVGVGAGSGFGGLGGSAGAGGSPPSGGSAGAAGSAQGGAPGDPPLAAHLGLGAFHSCSGFDDGTLRCWGTGGYIGAGNNETIGDDETPDVAGDVQIGGKVVKLAASWYHTCALLDSGNLRCFGHGGHGRLGYGDSEDIGNDETPASAGDVDVGGKVVDVSAGPFHTCACLDTGKVRCWGSNEYWQLGYSSTETIGDGESPASAGDVDVGGFAVQVAAGYGHTCALLDSGAVHCWGNGAEGRLGYGNEETIGDTESPASAGDVSLGGKAVQIVAGAFHTCALLDSGGVRCWGRASDGMLGYGNTQQIGDGETPADAGDVDVGGTVTELAAGDYATCAVLSSGAVRCWGGAYQGELGYGNLEDIGDTETPASVGDVDVGGKVTHIDVGFWHTSAILEAGTVRCWGRGSTGALGYGNLEDIGDTETPASAGEVKTH